MEVVVVDVIEVGAVELEAAVEVLGVVDVLLVDEIAVSSVLGVVNVKEVDNDDVHGVKDIEVEGFVDVEVVESVLIEGMTEAVEGTEVVVSEEEHELKAPNLLETGTFTRYTSESSLLVLVSVLMIPSFLIVFTSLAIFVDSFSFSLRILILLFSSLISLYFDSHSATDSSNSFCKWLRAFVRVLLSSS